MTNREFYSEQIKNYSGNRFCSEFIQPIILKHDGCIGNSCMLCQMKQLLWLDEEYEPTQQIDWSKVEVDTKVLVSDDGEDWFKRYFARYEENRVITFYNGMTSWNASNGRTTSWRYAKLAEVVQE